MSSVRCRECQALNDRGAVFCTRCGASLRGPGYPGGPRRRRRVTGSGAALSLALFVLLLATVFTLGVIVYRQIQPTENVDAFQGTSGTTASTSTTLGTGSSGTGSNGTGADGSGSSTTSTAPGLVLRPQAAKASSVLEPTSTNNYRATNLLDGDLATAWNEGAQGPGIGEWVRLEFAEPVILAHIEIANGYQKDRDRFLGNARVKSLKLEYSNGTTQLVDLLDTKDFQSITTLRKATEWLKLTIVSVYPDYEWADAALSEVRVYELAAQQ